MFHAIMKSGTENMAKHCAKSQLSELKNFLKVRSIYAIHCQGMLDFNIFIKSQIRNIFLNKALSSFKL